MHRILETGRTEARPTHDRGAAALALRTYRQIAAILEAQGGTPITPARVRQICEAAEMKIVRAVVDEPFHQQIAAMLAEQEGAPIDPTELAELCQEESRKFVRALLSDTGVSERSGCRSTCGRRAEGGAHNQAGTEAFKPRSNSKFVAPGIGSQS